MAEAEESKDDKPSLQIDVPEDTIQADSAASTPQNADQAGTDELQR